MKKDIIKFILEFILVALFINLFALFHYQDFSLEKVINAIIPSSESNVQDSIDDSETSSNPTVNSITIGKTISFENFDITFKSFSIVKDHENKDALKYVYDYKNKSDKIVRPFVTFKLKGFQEGIGTDSAIFVREGVDIEIGQREIKPGVTITDAEGVIGINDITKPLELDLGETKNFDNNVYTIEIDLSGLEK